MAIDQSFETLFAVPMRCDTCVKHVTDTLRKVNGVSSVDADLEKQLVEVRGTAPPSKIVAAIQSTGKDAILRGSGASNSAAVSILEVFSQDPKTILQQSSNPAREVRGLARMVEVSSGNTLVDLTTRGLEPGRYHATVREFGDLKHGVSSTGPVWNGHDGSEVSDMSSRKGYLGGLVVGEDGRGSAFLQKGFAIWEIIGHAMLVTKQPETEDPNDVKQNDANTVVGVIARSAGVWDNDKVVCSCSGKTLWEERREQVEKGML